MPSTSFTLFGLTPIQLGVIGGLMFIGLILLAAVKVQSLSKVLTVVGFAIILSGVPISVAIVNRQTRVTSQAGTENIPKNVLVKNIDQTTIAVLWDTDQPSVGVIRLRNNPNPQKNNTIYSETEGGEIYKHVIRLTDLKPDTVYYFEILSSGIWYDNHGQPLTFTTTKP